MWSAVIYTPQKKNRNRVVKKTIMLARCTLFSVYAYISRGWMKERAIMMNIWSTRKALVQRLHDDVYQENERNAKCTGRYVLFFWWWWWLADALRAHVLFYAYINPPAAFFRRSLKINVIYLFWCGAVPARKLWLMKKKKSAGVNWLVYWPPHLLSFACRCWECEW